MPKKLLDQILVIDVESTCWEGNPPAGQDKEIIEIGVCTVDVKSGELLDKESILVRPERSTVSEFCTQLTKLTQEQVATGISFREACEILKTKYRSRERVWASYGDYDRKQFEHQCQSFHVDYPFNSTHINVKSLVTLACYLPKEVGMPEALKLLKLSLQGTHHRAGDDAWNIASILATLIRRLREK
jgi:inhibitor of KinA sporulation pathway (predicted exonuclease)